MEHANLHRETRSGKMRAWGVALGVSAVTCSVWACSGVGPPGKPVVFGDQTNIVIWDEENKMEHFIRNANFQSGAEDFGFIAPTPGKPQLSDASTQAFYTLAGLAPITRSGGIGGGGFGGFGGGGSRSDQVKVIQEADIAGYRATTLWSKNAGAINDWMNEHGYVSTPEVEKWAERYCSWGWYLTAFKVIDKSKLAASTGTIRMSFKAREPYNPFYVPASNIPNRGKGTLRVYFVAAGDYDATIGHLRSWQTPIWTAQIPEATAAKLTKEVKLPAGAIPEKSKVHTFVDTDFPRPAEDDIYFVKKAPAPPAAPAEAPKTIPPFAFPLIAGFGLLVVAKQRKE